MADLNINALEATQRVGWASRGGFTSTADAVIAVRNAADSAYGSMHLALGSKSATAVRFNALGAGNGWYGTSTGGIGIAISGASFLHCNDSNSGMSLHSAWPFAWGSGAADAAADLRLYRMGAGHLGIRNSTNAQKQSTFNTYGSDTNFESFIIDWQAETNVCLLATAKGSSGTQRGLKIGDSTQTLGFYGTTPAAQQVLATGASATVDDVITFLQTVGLCKQS